MQHNKKPHYVPVRPSRNAFIMSPDSKKVPGWIYEECFCHRDKDHILHRNPYIARDNVDVHSKLKLASHSDIGALPGRKFSKSPYSTNIISIGDYIARNKKKQPRKLDFEMPYNPRNAFIYPNESHKTSHANVAVGNYCDRKLNETFKFEVRNVVNDFNGYYGLNSAECSSNTVKLPSNIKPNPKPNKFGKPCQENATENNTENSCDGFMNATFTGGVDNVCNNFIGNYTRQENPCAHTDVISGSNLLEFQPNYYKINYLCDEIESKEETTNSD